MKLYKKRASYTGTRFLYNFKNRSTSAKSRSALGFVNKLFSSPTSEKAIQSKNILLKKYFE
ncbi:hypothetical protein COA08_11495 [Bacillus cereus]|uniref:Uncharacterized protein n=1 Tax=Bacillus cereus TaxID=1396 RepID=A0A2B8T7P2_BACCE|nr:hypothetical protein CON06_15870 [Bacillus cereus]PFA03426.1 hypothetical protein CN382_29100 [Bacillus cereus]PFM34011.1 hypothetical protein COJ43_24720 [Bacillus cereus]PGL60861.1 hypothetical protein CN927_13755 [Bacillus cereus]PGQ09379.1 hypothetical protein COA08_11495 [Bacillus cereus]